MVAAIATTKRPATPAQIARKRSVTCARKRYIKSAVILIEGARARVTSQSDGDRRYDVVIGKDDKAEKCSCPDYQWNHNPYCKHMEAVDYQRSLPVLPQSVAKFRKVRGQAKLVAVPAKEVEAIEEVKEETQSAVTRRRTARLTPQPKAVSVTIIECHDIAQGGVRCQCTDSEGTACTVTLRRNKLHECSCGARSRCVHIVHCVTVENARWKMRSAAAVEETKKVVEVPTKPMDERIKDAPLNGNRGFNLLR